MPRLAEQQAKLRQQAEALALKLRRYHVPSGSLETSIGDLLGLLALIDGGEVLALLKAHVE